MKIQTCDFGFLVAPDSGTHPGVVLIHDVWGLKDHTREISERLATHGFNVLAIDLYRNFEAKEIQNPGAWIRQLRDPEIVADIRDASAFLAAHRDTADSTVGIVGFCMGGMYALLAGCDSQGSVSAVVPFYGLLSHSGGLMAEDEGIDPSRKPVEPIEAAKNLQCPLLGFFGEEDQFVSVQDIDRLEAAAAQSGQPARCVRYPAAGHAFMNDTYPDAFRPDIALDAWEQMVAFLKEELGA